MEPVHEARLVYITSQRRKSVILRCLKGVLHGVRFRMTANSVLMCLHPPLHKLLINVIIILQ